MTASLRATATLALRSPFRLASLIPQAFSADHFGTRVSSTLAASNRYVRSMASPHLEIRPDQSTCPSLQLIGLAAYRARARAPPLPMSHCPSAPGFRSRNGALSPP